MTSDHDPRTAFRLVSRYAPAGDQPAAIRALIDGIASNAPRQVLAGVTGSGKTLTVAHVIAEVNRPVLILTHNKTLGEQLHREFRELFPDNCVTFLHSVYVSYQPESYLPASDTYLKKRTWKSTEAEADARAALVDLTGRRDIIVIATTTALFDKTHTIPNFPRPSPSVVQATITAELDDRLAELHAAGALLQAATLEGRVRANLNSMATTGSCPGIENYSRHRTGRAPGQRPHCLLDILPTDTLVVVDESHVTMPQIAALVPSGQKRIWNLIASGHVLPSAIDNRPLTLDEFEDVTSQIIYVSATPGEYELRQSGQCVVKQVIRPTGLLDPVIEICPKAGQTERLVNEIQNRAARGERTLVSTVTQRLAELVSEHLKGRGIHSEWLHADRPTEQRNQIVRGLREGAYDVLVGVNLLREGIDLPEVSLVAILGADVEGFLRDETSLVQLTGRAARNVNGAALLFADRQTPAMHRAIDRTNRHRNIQQRHNELMGRTPMSIVRVASQSANDAPSTDDPIEAIRPEVRRSTSQ